MTTTKFILVQMDTEDDDHSPLATFLNNITVKDGAPRIAAYQATPGLFRRVIRSMDAVDREQVVVRREDVDTLARHLMQSACATDPIVTLAMTRMLDGRPLTEHEMTLE